MKYNLKSRKPFPNEKLTCSIGEATEYYEEWFQGFEKELRQKLEECRKEVKFCQKNLGLFSAVPFIAQIKLIQEILGEDVSE